MARMAIIRAAALGVIACAVGAARAQPSGGGACHVVIMAGQSNMIGNFGLDELEFGGVDYAVAQSDVLEDYHIDYVERVTGWGPLSTHTEVPNSTYGPELTFGRTLADADLPAQVAIIKVAFGGTNLASRWNPANQNDLYDLLIDQVNRSMDELETMGYEPEVTGFAWVQGDGDLWVPEWVAAYEENLHALVGAVRLDLDAPQMQALIAQTPITHNKPADLVAIMRQAKANFAADDPHASLVFTDDLTFYDANIHFDGTSRLVLGQRLGTAYLNDSVFGPPCPADLDANGVLNGDDVDAFVSAFFAGEPAADLSGDGRVNLDDLDAFTTAFLAGCP